MAACSVCLLGMGYRALGPHGYIALQKREAEKSRLLDEVHSLTIENIRLSSDVEKLKNDPRTMENLARQELKLAKPGEYIYVLPPETPKR